MNVWYHTKAISNILSLNNARYDNIIIYNYNNGFRFTMSNKIPGGHDMISTENNGEIYYNYKRNTEGVSMLIMWRKSESTTLNDNMSVKL